MLPEGTGCLPSPGGRERTGGGYQKGALRKGDFVRKFTVEMTPLKIGEETVRTGGVRIRSETENVLWGSVLLGAVRWKCSLAAVLTLRGGSTWPPVRALLPAAPTGGTGEGSQEVGGSREEESFRCIPLYICIYIF